MSNAIERQNKAVMKANQRLDHLWANNVNAEARLTAQGVEIRIERPAFGGKVSVSFEIIPFEES